MSAVARVLSIAVGCAVVSGALLCLRDTLNIPEDDYAAVLAAIEDGAARHAPEVAFGDAGASEDTVRSVLEDALPGHGLGIYSKQRTKTMRALDRYAVDASSCTYSVVTRRSRSAVMSVSLEYFLDADQVGESEEIVEDIAAKAGKLKDRRERLRFLHDWVVLHSAYGDAESGKWGEAARYGVGSPAVNGCSGAQLVGHRGMCHSYALTFLRLCEAAGIDDMRYVGCITGHGASADHALTALKIDGKWEYIDVTWDDPVYSSDVEPDFEAPDKASHRFFLKDRGYMERSGHRFS